MAIATLDFHHYRGGSTDEHEQFCRNLVTQLSQYGFTKIKNSVFSQEMIEKLFDYNRAFFDLPDEIKAQVAHPETPNPHRGWSGVGKESVVKISGFEQDRSFQGNYEEYRESWDQGAANDNLYPNVWLPESIIPGFRAFMESFYDSCYDLTMQLMTAICTGLGLPPSLLLSKHQTNTSELRLLHYPPIPCRKLGTGMRIGEHSDFGSLTLLVQDACGGLEVEDQALLGTFIPIEPDSRYEVIVNVGDCLQRWTNRRLRSANHRVTLPRGKSANSDEVLDRRYSVAYFGKPDRDVLVDSLPEFCGWVSSNSLDGIDSDTAKGYYTDHLTALEYMQTKLLRTYA